MRLKIIVPHAIVVLFVGLLSFFIVRTRLTSQVDVTQLKTATEQIVTGVAGNLEVQMLSAERWLEIQVAPGTANAKQLIERLNEGLLDRDQREKTTQLLANIVDLAETEKIAFNSRPSLAILVTRDMTAIGCSATPQTFKGDSLHIPSFRQALDENRTVSDWLNSQVLSKSLAAIAPIIGEDGKAVAGVILVWNLTDERLGSWSSLSIAFGSIENNALQLESHVDRDVPLSTQIESGTMKDLVAQARDHSIASAVNRDSVIAFASLRDLGDGHHAMVVVAQPTVTSNADFVTLPILLAIALGLAFVVVIGVLQANYIEIPISKMEETLLAVVNGNTALRINVEHEELGGLATRINQLVNIATGTEEDTDEEGRPPPSIAGQNLTDDLGGAEGEARAAALAGEDETAYYERIFQEYIEAKKANNESIENITKDVFINRVKQMESDASKAGKPVRYAIERRENKVVFISIPMPSKA